MYFQARLKKKFPEFEIDLKIGAQKGEIVTILGHSGSGKTTVLQMIAGILNGETSEISIDGKSVENLPPEKRGFGMVFQDKLLFPHMSVFENASFGLKMRKLDVNLANRALALVSMQSFSKRNVENLSGGEKQRVAIARAIAYNPSLLLLDEPLKELDAVLKEQIKAELRKLIKKLDMTTIFVTHDVEEAFFLSDKIYLIDKGKVVQKGKPLELLQKPKNSQVKRYFSPYLLLKKGGKYIIAKKNPFPKDR